MLVMVATGVVVYSIRKSNQLFDLGVQAHGDCAGTAQAPGPEFASLLQPLLDAAGAAEAVSARQCTVEGREYIDVTIQSDAKPVSVILTRKRDQEMFPRAFSGHTEEVDGTTLHETRRSGNAIAAFESGNWLAYVVSGLSAENNAELARKLAPVIDRYAKA